MITFCVNNTPPPPHPLTPFTLRYSNLRNAHIKQYYHRRPNVLKLVQLLSTTSIKELSNLGKYLERSNKLRNKLLEL